MPTIGKEQFTGCAAPELLATMKQVARADGVSFDDALEDAMRLYIAKWRANRPGVLPEVMAHARDSLERHRRLYELLAESEQKKR